MDQQLCRWLLLCLDRLSSNQLAMTQELIANMLGVRREGVTGAAGSSCVASVLPWSRWKPIVCCRALRPECLRGLKLTAAVSPKRELTRPLN